MMNSTNKLRIATGLVLLAGLAACGGDDSSAPPFNLGAASSDGNISQIEAGSLSGSSTEVGEPDNVSNLALATSETDEPFDLPN